MFASVAPAEGVGVAVAINAAKNTLSVAATTAFCNSELNSGTAPGEVANSFVATTIALAFVGSSNAEPSARVGSGLTVAGNCGFQNVSDARCNAFSFALRSRVVLPLVAQQHQGELEKHTSGFSHYDVR